MDNNEAQALAGSMADVVSGADHAAATRVVARLAGLSGRDWLRLDELARCIWWGESPLYGVIDWSPALTALEATTGWLPPGSPAADRAMAVRVAASMCRDGRVREAATPASG